jgi:hypothetical protein
MSDIVHDLTTHDCIQYTRPEEVGSNPTYRRLVVILLSDLFIIFIMKSFASVDIKLITL